MCGSGCQDVYGKDQFESNGNSVLGLGIWEMWLQYILFLLNMLSFCRLDKYAPQCCNEKVHQNVHPAQDKMHT